MQFDPQFIPRICALDKIYTVRSSCRHHNKDFELQGVFFRPVAFESYMFCNFKKKIFDFDPIEFGFDTKEAMLDYYCEWFGKKDFYPWSRLCVYRLWLVGFK